MREGGVEEVRSFVRSRGVSSGLSSELLTQPFTIVLLRYISLRRRRGVEEVRSFVRWFSSRFGRSFEEGRSFEGFVVDCCRPSQQVSSHPPPGPTPMPSALTSFTPYPSSWFSCVVEEARSVGRSKRRFTKKSSMLHTRSAKMKGGEVSTNAISSTRCPSDGSFRHTC